MFSTINYFMNDYNSLTLYISIGLDIVVLIFIALQKMIIPYISHKMIFKPGKVDYKVYDNIKNSKHFIHETIKTDDGCLLDGCLYNTYKTPSYDAKVIYLFNHGNSGWLGSVIKSSTVEYLSRFGSVFVYDYRGYGASTGIPYDDGLFEDSRTVYKFLITDKNVDPEKIVIFGHSLGTCISVRLMQYIQEQYAQNVKHKTQNIKHKTQKMILQNPFLSMKEIAKEVIPILGNFVISKFKTDSFMKIIDTITNKVEVVIIHCLQDELIHHNHGLRLHELLKNNKSHLLLIPGSHDEPLYNVLVDNKIREISKLCVE